jgi:O-antigen ligase
MPAASDIKILKLNIVLALLIVPIFIAPWWVIYPYSIPKLIPLVGFSSASIVSIFYYFKSRTKSVTFFTGLSTLLSIWLVITLFYPHSNMLQEIYGIDGRNTGFITYFSLLVLMVGAYIISDQEFLKVSSKVIFFVGTISAIYGILQSQGFFNILQLAQDGNISIGFLGNINFQSSFLAIFSVLSLNQFLFNSQKIFNKLLYLSLVIMGIVAIYVTNSQQGFLVFGLGSLFLGYIYVRSFDKLTLKRFYLIFSFLSVSLILIAIFQIGPLTNLIYEKSISIRGYYWNAGIQMIAKNPIFGIGFDGYRDWYWRSRSKIAFQDLGKEDWAENAHNVFIDIGASGGIPLLIIYSLLIIYTGYCGYKKIFRLKQFNYYFLGIYAAWGCYVAQSILSINQIGIATLGWIFSGLIIGYEKIDKQSVVMKVQKEKVWDLKIWSGWLSGFLLGIYIAIIPNINSSNYRQAIELQDTQLLYRAALAKPYNSQLMVSAAEVFLVNGQEKKAKEIILIATENFPDYYKGWETMAKFQSLPIKLKAIANNEMARLDPLRNPG